MMSKDTLSEYGRNTNQPQREVASSGGVKAFKPMPYSEPQGPKGINDPKTAGIHGTNLGTCGTQGKR